MWGPGNDALADVCHLCCIIQGLWQFKKLNVSGTGNRPNTWMLNLFSWFDTKLQHAANCYNVAYTALKALDPNGGWKEQLKEPSDLWGPGRDSDNPEDAKRSNGWFEPSWIWLVAHTHHKRRGRIRLRRSLTIVCAWSGLRHELGCVGGRKNCWLFKRRCTRCWHFLNGSHHGGWSKLIKEQV